MNLSVCSDKFLLSCVFSLFFGQVSQLYFVKSFERHPSSWFFVCVCDKPMTCQIWIYVGKLFCRHRSAEKQPNYHFSQIWMWASMSLAFLFLDNLRMDKYVFLCAVLNIYNFAANSNVRNSTAKNYVKWLTNIHYLRSSPVSAGCVTSVIS